MSRQLGRSSGLVFVGERGGVRGGVITTSGNTSSGKYGSGSGAGCGTRGVGIGCGGIFDSRSLSPSTVGVSTQSKRSNPVSSAPPTMAPSRAPARDAAGSGVGGARSFTTTRSPSMRISGSSIGVGVPTSKRGIDGNVRGTPGW